MLNPDLPMSHLKKLPPKSYKVAPGDVIGGLVYVMDKPLGIEEGMVGISIDSPGYRQFIKEQLALLQQQKNLPSPELQKRFNTFYKKNKIDFDAANEQTKIDMLMADKVHEKRRYGASWKEFKDVLFSFGKYHEMKGLQSYYVNKGMGGLLFDSYKKHCKISKKDHFAKHINKLIENDNKAVMVKQDGKMVNGGTGPGWKKILKTTTGKKLQRLVNPFVVIFTAGLSALVFGVALGLWRRHYLKNNTPTSVNADAIVESLSTKLAAIRGFTSQEIDTIEGTYKNGAPKVVTAVTWMPGCRDLSDKLAGGKDNYTSVIVAWDKHDVPYKVATIHDKEYTIRAKGKDKNGTITGYEKVDQNGKVTPATLADYQAGKLISNDAISGLGESLLSFIAMADRDGMGKMGQNKAILPLKNPQGNMTHQFFGIDFGKSYKGPNPIVNSLNDDFSFDNPEGIRERFVNYSALYDNPLREKMKGIYLLAALRGKLSDEEKEKIAAEYQAGNDPIFAEKLRQYPASVGGKDSDIKLIAAEKRKYLDLANDPKNTAQRDEYLQYADRLDQILTISQKTDNAILKTFNKRMHLTPTQIDLLDNIEKLTANQAHTLSPDNQVHLNHIRVERADRTQWQLQKNIDGTFNLVCENKDNLPAIAQRLSKIKDENLSKILAKAAESEGKLSIKNLSVDEINTLSKELTEQKVAQTHQLPYRSVATRNHFHESLRQADAPKAPQKPPVSKPIDIPKARFHDEPKAKMPPMHPISHQFQLSVPINANRLEAVLVQSGTLKSVENVLADEQHRSTCQTTGPAKQVKIGTYNPEPGLEVSFQDARSSHEVEAFVQQVPHDELRYSVDKECNEHDFKFAMKAICRLALQNAEPNSTFEMMPSTPEKSEILKEAFAEAIEESLAAREPRFTQQNAPRLVAMTRQGPDHQNRTMTNF